MTITIGENLKLYTVAELAKITKVKEKTLVSYCRTGRIKAKKFGGNRWMISENALKEFFQEA